MRTCAVGHLPHLHVGRVGLTNSIQLSLAVVGAPSITWSLEATTRDTPYMTIY